MQLTNWISHIIVFGGQIPYLILDNLPFDYVNPYGHSTERRALLIPVSDMLFSNSHVGPAERKVDTNDPLGIVGSVAFSDFVRNLTSTETNDRYRGLVTGNIEFHLICLCH